MATNPSTLSENSGRITAPDANYPYGSAKNDSTGTTGDGTPIRAPLMNDTYGFYQALLTRAGIVPSGNAETALVSQLADAVAALGNTFNAAIATIASSGTVDLTAGAPDTSQITITGNVAITGFTVEAGRAFFAKFTGSPTLTNNAAIVTQTGANIVIVPGESVLLRATAANVVEVIQSRQNVRAAMNVAGDAPMFACRCWVNFDGVPGVPVIRGSGNVSSVGKTGTGQYTVNFITSMPDANYAVLGKGFGAGSDFAGATATNVGNFTCQSRSPANVGVNIDALLNFYGVFR